MILFGRSLEVQDAEVTNWDMRLVNASYEWVERQMTFQPTVHGFQAAVRAALLEANVTPWNGFTVDHVAGTKVGATTFDASGRRHSAADLLAFARPSRLRVAIRATVTRIITNPVDPGEKCILLVLCLLPPEFGKTGVCMTDFALLHGCIVIESN